MVMKPTYQNKYKIKAIKKILRITSFYIQKKKDYNRGDDEDHQGIDRVIVFVETKNQEAYHNGNE